MEKAKRKLENRNQVKEKITKLICGAVGFAESMTVPTEKLLDREIKIEIYRREIMLGYYLFVASLSSQWAPIERTGGKTIHFFFFLSFSCPAQQSFIRNY